MNKNVVNTDNDNIIIDFSTFNFCFRTVTVGDFTNKLKNIDEFKKKFKNIIEVEIPFYSKKKFSNIFFDSKHCHDIKQGTKEYELIVQISKQLYKELKGNPNEKDIELFISNFFNDYSIWQLGCIQGTRLIGIKKSNVFSVLFIDYHHLIYPDEKHNQTDYLSNSFCIIE